MPAPSNVVPFDPARRTSGAGPDVGMKVLVCGRERFTDRTFIHNTLTRLNHERGPFGVVMQFGSGAGAGPDSEVRNWVWGDNVDLDGVDVKRCVLRTFRHDWDRYGPGAHHKTYEDILRHDPPHLVIVFGPEQGQHRPFVRRAREQSIPVIEFPFDETMCSVTRRAARAGT